MRFIGLLAGTAVLALSALCGAEEWPKWLGPRGDGISTEPIADKWPQGGPHKVWEQKVGRGFSSPIALDGKVYLLSMVGANDVLTCFDANSGNPIWSQSYLVTIPADQGQAKNEENGLPLPEATPTIDNGKIYTYGGGGDLYCRNVADGSEVWHVNILKKTHERILGWNEASSPLVTDKLVYVQGGVGGPVTFALDKTNGNIVWQSQATGIAGYAAPILADVAGQLQLIILAGKELFAMDPSNGKTLWSHPWITSFDVNASTPIYHDGRLFISSDYRHGCLMTMPSHNGTKDDWQGTQIQAKFQPSILENGVIYADSAGLITCVNWSDGKVRWQTRETNLRLGEGGSIVRDGDKLIAMSERGRLSLVRATPDAYKLISQVQLFDFISCWSTPLIYHGRLYAMGENNLVCLDIASRQARNVGSDHAAQAH